ncbi:endonuclease/exonuclease/phosphatase family metal-dependent hydrolase [Conyzicola lurida]|uniref:Endonuclease/exonuclease/phosphatase family metal-dependent hydrolase n=1 Tax=Conyzicola lurida TaxID=1172621 RepID=A0A841AJ08_9MICO|nr:endonuclease/exonuclease/phosphatase family protein [Conyzicola lurida]MBB5843207.1 endonuclease/exonuclease/phosphatase family metal-dependent hydrolase [Conyzicola lurida]
MTDIAFIGHVPPPALHVMTYNIRRRMTRLPPRSRDNWSRRKHLLARVLRVEQPALLGVQEALLDQARFVGEALGPDYRRIGYGRNPNTTGEGCPVFYDSRRLDLLGWRQFALSATPDVPGSRGWGNRVPRLVVAAEFRDRATGIAFRSFNTHFDHQSSAARLQSAKQLTRLIAQGSGPVILTGDANAGIHSAPYRQLTHEAGLVDAWLMPQRRLSEDWTTFSNYRPPKVGGKRIDWLLVGGGVEVTAMGINAVRFDGAAPSDHEPVQAVLRLG